MQLQDTPAMEHADSALTDALAEARWMAWQARGAASDRRSGRIMSGVFAIAMILLAGWLVAQGALMTGERGWYPDERAANVGNVRRHSADNG